MMVAKRLVLLVLFVGPLIAAGCDSGGGAPECLLCGKTPKAIPADNNSFQGPSKGVFAGPYEGAIKGGTYTSDVSGDQTEGYEGWCWLSFEGILIEANSFAAQEVSPDRYRFMFSSDPSTSPSFELTFEVVLTANGKDIENADLRIDNVSMNEVMEPETTTSACTCYEGVWSGDGYSGAWNFLTCASSINGIFEGDVAGQYTGTLSGQSANIVTYPGNTPLATGTVSTKSASGSWSYSGASGGWSGYQSCD